MRMPIEDFQNFLKQINEKIRQGIPKLPKDRKPKDYKSTIKLSTINDIQQRAAEIYALNKREIDKIERGLAIFH